METLLGKKTLGRAARQRETEWLFITSFTSEMKKRKVRGWGRVIVPLERAILRATKAVGKSERAVKNILRDFENVGRSEEASLHAQKYSA
jgi:hypothetical protein